MEDRAKDEQAVEPPDLAPTAVQVAQAMTNVEAIVRQAFNSDGMRQFLQAMARFGTFVRENQSEIRSFGEALRALPENLQAGVALLAQRGWFVDEEMGLSDISYSGAAAQNGTSDQIDALMVAHFEQQLDNIEERLVALAPARAQILRAAFGAVRRGDGDLAVPLLLIQADGLCHDHGLGSFFIRDKKDRHVPLAMKRLGDRGVRMGLLYSPVYRVLPLYMTSNERDKSFKGLNRHQVLHGESVDYGTHENSLRAVSLLNCIALLLRDSEAPERGVFEGSDEGSNT